MDNSDTVFIKIKEGEIENYRKALKESFGG